MVSIVVSGEVGKPSENRRNIFGEEICSELDYGWFFPA
jgi:hypothetical protein